MRALDLSTETLMKYKEKIAPTTSFEEAKQAADETYTQYWYDRANEISSKWEDEDYALIAEPKTERYRPANR